MTPCFSRSAFAVAAALVVALTASRAAAQAPAESAPELALVHPDAVGFVHVRLADLWDDPSLAEVRAVFEKAGPAAFGTLDTQFTPKPSTVDRVTAVMLPPGSNGEPRAVSITRFKTAFDPAAVLKAYLPNGKPTKVGGKLIVADEKTQIAACFPDDKTLVIADPATLAEYLTWAPKDDGVLAPALPLAASKPLTVAVNVPRIPLPPGFPDEIPEDFRPLTKAQLVTLTIGFGKDPVIDVRATFADAAATADGEAALKRVLAFARAALTQPRAQYEKNLTGKGYYAGDRSVEELQQVVVAVAALGACAELDAILADPPVKRDGSALSATIPVPPWAGRFLGAPAVTAGLVVPTIQKLRAAAARSTSMNNLRWIAVAMHNYESAWGQFPPAASTDKTGKKLLSWRVAVLPYLEQDALYKSFKLDEPWDSEHNKKLIPLMPKVYADPRLTGTATAEGKTVYKLFVGGGAAFDPVKPRKIIEIEDGTVNTIMVAAGGTPVPWTKPEDNEFDPKKPVPNFWSPFPEILVAFCDGSVRVLSVVRFKNDEKSLKGLIMAADGELVNLD
ncbi:MAG: DUF1559 domain-containing protein [Fimbriiglobus sp.]